MLVILTEAADNAALEAMVRQLKVNEDERGVKGEGDGEGEGTGGGHVLLASVVPFFSAGSRSALVVALVGPSKAVLEAAWASWCAEEGSRERTGDGLLC